MGGGFLAAVCGKWEAAAEPARAAGLRVAHLRLGLVLTPAGGMLKPLRPVFRAGAGGTVGDGTQGMSWVGLDDVVGAFHHALFDDSLPGRSTSPRPEPVSNARVHRRARPRPASADAACRRPPSRLRLLLGRQMADETALSSAWVRPDAPRGRRLRLPAPHARRGARPLPALSARPRRRRSGARPV